MIHTMNLIRTFYQMIPAPIRRLRHDGIRILRSIFQLTFDYCYDLCRFVNHSSTLRVKGTRQNNEAKLIFLYHKIEKALALPNPRAGFGKTWILSDFVPLISSYVADYGPNTTTDSCLINLQIYRDFNMRKNYIDPELSSALDCALAEVKMSKDKANGGIQTIQRASICLSSESFSDFMRSRHSTRDFSQEPVSKALIEKAVHTAQRTPSVCNRQPWHVYAYEGKSKIAEALKLQTGNAGFGDRVPMLLIAAGDIGAMLNSTERNQFRVDGGMFSMSLVLALHSLGLVSCCLNLCHGWREEQKLRRFVGMNSNHTPLMMIAVGHTLDSFAIAMSQRKPVSEVLTWK